MKKKMKKIHTMTEALASVLEAKNTKPKRDEPNELWARSTNLIAKSSEPTEAYQILQRILKFVGMLGIVLGCEWKYEWKSNRRFVFIKFLIAFLGLMSLYTQSLYIHQKEAIRIVEVFAVYGTVVSLTLKLRCFKTYVKNMTALVKSTLKICHQSTGMQAEKLKQRLLKDLTFCKTCVSLALLCAGFYLYYPVQSYVTKGELVPFVPIEIMFVVQLTISGYCIASTLMISGGIICCLTTTYVVLIFVIIIMNCGIRVNIFEANFKELEEMWSGVSQYSVAYRHMFFRNVFRKVIDMRHYIAEVKKIFDRKLFLFFVVAYISEILCLYQIRVNDWIPGYGLAAGFFLEMIFYCILGTKLTLENDRLVHIIWQSNWYTYDMRSQKLIMMLLNITINSDELWIGPLKPLSVYTAAEITNSIYSYYTLKLEVL